MIALDTNVLVRLVACDDKRQTEVVRRFLDKEAGPFFVGEAVLLELVWALHRKYGFERTEIANVLEALLDRPDFETEDGNRIRTVLRVYRQGGDFADHLVAAHAHERGCAFTATFDQDFARRYPEGTRLLR